MTNCRWIVVVAFLLAGLCAPAFAESPPVVGWLWFRAPIPANLRLFEEGLKNLGYEVGRNVLLEVRYAGADNANFPAPARALLDYKPTVVFAPCGLGQRAIRDISPTVPIVAMCADEKSFLGEVASLRRPGGATTGVTFLAPESMGKRLELLKEIRPDTKRVAFLYHSGDPWENYWREIERVAPQLGLTVLRIPFRRAEDLEGALAAALRERADAIYAFPDTAVVNHAGRIAEFALQHRVATAFDVAGFAEGGGLFSYGVDFSDLFHRVVPRFIDKILKGAKPGDLPIEQPTRFELVVNLKTAKALGLTVPQSILLRADRVIE